MSDQCLLHLVGLLAQFVEGCADNMKVSRVISSHVTFFPLFLPFSKRWEGGERRREKGKLCGMKGGGGGGGSA